MLDVIVVGKGGEQAGMPGKEQEPTGEQADLDDLYGGDAAEVAGAAAEDPLDDDAEVRHYIHPQAACPLYADGLCHLWGQSLLSSLVLF